MVELEEVEDRELEAPQPGPIDDDEDSADFTDTDSSLSTTSLPPITLGLPDETLTERFLALRDMLAPSTRRRLAQVTAQVTSVLKSGAVWGGKGMWVVTASALMLGVPWAMAFVEEQQMVEMEREQRARESAGEVLTPGATASQPGAQQGRAAL